MPGGRPRLASRSSASTTSRLRRGGHEELYFVLSGRATFTVDGERVDAPAGSLVFVKDPAMRRGAVADEAGTKILAIGGRPACVRGVSVGALGRGSAVLDDR